MEEKTIKLLFALVRSALTGDKIPQDVHAQYTSEQLPDLIKTAQKQDIAHLVVFGLKQNGLLTDAEKRLEQYIHKAVFRHEGLVFEYGQICDTLEQAQIPFLPLKGSILRDYYPQAWMRTSCDIDILVRREHLEDAVAYLTQNLQYEEKERATHDVSLFSPSGVHLELHFDLVEEDRANNATAVLNTVWDDVSLCDGRQYHYQMSDAFFYFYHIAHMAKHFELGGCGIKPFIDLWILERRPTADNEKREQLLENSGLTQFARACRKLSKAWLEGEEMDELSLQMQSFILHGGVYGSADNRVVLQQKKHGGKIGYIFSRMFVPYERLKRYYPVLEKHRWLTPIMQVRRWFMLLNPRIRKMAKKELKANSNLGKAQAEEMHVFLDSIGLQ